MKLYKDTETQKYAIKIGIYTIETGPLAGEKATKYRTIWQNGDYGSIYFVPAYRDKHKMIR